MKYGAIKYACGDTLTSKVINLRAVDDTDGQAQSDRRTWTIYQSEAWNISWYQEQNSRQGSWTSLATLKIHVNASDALSTVAC
jgi:hypothetical protein